MIIFSNISKEYKTDFWAKPIRALDDISFKIEAGDLVGFLGPNGAGKTTTIKLLMGFIRPNSGSIEFSQTLGDNKASIVDKIGLLPERPFFFPFLTGRQFLKYMGELSEVPKRDLDKRIEELCTKLQIKEALSRKINTYSKGMIQRLGFASSLLHDPEVLILDEPLSGMDPIGRKMMKDILLELNKAGKTIFFSSHIVSDVEQICKKVIVLEKGEIVYQGRIDSLVEKHESPTHQVEFAIEKDIKFETSILSAEKKQDLGFIEVDSGQLDKALEEIIKSGGRIVSVNKVRPTLEQIIFRIGQDR